MSYGKDLAFSSWPIAHGSWLLMRDFQELQVWQRAHQVTLKVYEVTRSFPADERYGVTSQLCRASSSIAANIAEGCGRNGDTELARFLTIALGSLAETIYFVILARDLKYLAAEQADSLQQDLVTLRKMLITFNRHIKPYAPRPHGP